MAGAQGEQQLRFETDMGEFIGNDGATEDSQALAIRDRFESAVIDISNELCAHEHIEIELQTAEPAHPTEDAVGPIGSLERHPVILQEGPQERCVEMLLADQQFDDPDQVRDALRPRAPLGRSQKRLSLRLFAQLKCRHGARDEPPFAWLQDVGQAVQHTVPVQRVIFEVIQPDLEIAATHGPLLF